MWKQLTGVNPEFIDMCIRTVQGELSVHDDLTASPQAAMARMLALQEMTRANGAFVNAVVNSNLFQRTCEHGLKQIEMAGPESGKLVFVALMAQAVLMGLHVHEQLLDKMKKGLIY